MIGIKKGAKLSYVLSNPDAANPAPVSDGNKSVTLIPNVKDWGDKETLADMAGFGDKRTYIGVLGVSYMLKGAFEKINQCRFIVVIQSNNMGN